MRRFKIGIFLLLIVMLTGCAENTSLREDTELSRAEAQSIDEDRENNGENSDLNDKMEDALESKREDKRAKEAAMSERADGVTEENIKVEQPDNPPEDSAEATETDESDETDTIYLKPCNSYQDILDNVYIVITHRGDDIVEADDIFISVGIWEAGIGRSTDEALAGIGYTFYDVDGNGIEELFIMDTSEDSSVWDNRILAMYSLFDGKPVLVIDGWARNRYYLLNDGTFYNEGSGGAAYTIFATYRMAGDGISIEVIDYYFSDYRDDSFEEYWLAEGNWGWFHNTTGEWDKDKSEFMEFEDEDAPWEMMENYMEQVKELDLTFFEEMKE